MESLNGKVKPGSKQTIEKNTDQEYVFPLLNLLAKIPLHPIVTYTLFALGTYFAFLVIALVEGAFPTIISSFMHIQQISVSLAIFVGLALARSTSLMFDRILAASGQYFNANAKDYDTIRKDTRLMIGKWYGAVLTIPFSIISILSFWSLSSGFPDIMYPISRYSATFIYMAYIEFSLFCLYLLGAVAFWFLLVTINVFGQLEKYELRPFALRASSKLYELPGVMFQAAIYIFICMGIILPPLTYIIIQTKSAIVQWGGIIGIVGEYIVLLFLAGMAQLSIHRLILRAKYQRLDNINDAFDRIQRKIEAFPEGFPDGKEGYDELDKLINLNGYLRDSYEDTDKLIKEWPFDLRNLGQLVASGLIPIASLISMLLSLFKK